MAAAVDDTRQLVIAATFRALIRIAGGGFLIVANNNGNDTASSAPPSLELVVVAPPNDDDDGNNHQWRKELMQISRDGISFTNNGSNTREIDGKPHDWEVRAALMLYHRVLRGRTKNNYGQKRNKNTTVAARNDPHELPISPKSYNRTKRKVNNYYERPAIEFISDLGTYRRIESIVSLANLLALELERELLTHHEQPQQPSSGNMTSLSDDMMSTSSFADIRSNESGIIYLLSFHRSKQLYSHGHIPCPNCTRWFKGFKGLWWHQLSVHGIHYSIATDIAANVANSLAIVVYDERNAKTMKMTDILDEEENVAFVNGMKETREGNEAFSLVKMGKYDELTKLIKDKECTPTTILDHNGASLLHWAAGCGNVDIVTFLVEQCHCCPNQLQMGKKSFSGRTPLHWAARNGHLNVVRYLVTNCCVDVNGETSDGTTALCWASWQGHLEIMKFLFENGANVHSTNKFGCNALLWSAQGVCSMNVMTWLFESGLDFSLTNTNGHSAFHKAAQRGNYEALKWFAENFLSKEIVTQVFVGPDNEGHCPSDLCGLEGHLNLAVWISEIECDFIIGLVRPATSVEDLLANNSSSIPAWLVQDLIVRHPAIGRNISDRELSWGSGCGVRRMSEIVIKHFENSSAQHRRHQQLITSVKELNDID